jgi:hypothetical protein
MGAAGRAHIAAQHDSLKEAAKLRALFEAPVILIPASTTYSHRD